MFSKAPEFYDAIYGAFKDYDAEAERVAQLLQEAAPTARRILDVGCERAANSQARQVG